MPDEKSLTLTLDLVNEESFLEVIQRAIDVVACAELIGKNPAVSSTPEGARLNEACESFRAWFENGDID